MRSARTGLLLHEDTIKHMEECGLVFERPITKQFYSTEPSNQIDPQRALQQKPFYRHISHSSRKELKKVIFADWRLNYLSDKWREYYLINLKTLLHDVMVYIWNGKELIATDNIYHFTCVLPLMQVADKKTLQAAMKAKGMVNDQVLVLDYAYANHIKLASTLWKIERAQYNINFNASLLKQTFLLRDLMFVPPLEQDAILKNLDTDSFIALDLTVLKSKKLLGLTKEDEKTLIQKICAALPNLTMLYLDNDALGLDDILSWLPQKTLSTLQRIVCKYSNESEYHYLLSEISDLLEKYKNTNIEIVVRWNGSFNGWKVKDLLENKDVGLDQITEINLDHEFKSFIRNEEEEQVFNCHNPVQFKHSEHPNLLLPAHTPGCISIQHRAFFYQSPYLLNDITLDVKGNQAIQFESQFQFGGIDHPPPHEMKPHTNVVFMDFKKGEHEIAKNARDTFFSAFPNLKMIEFGRQDPTDFVPDSILNQLQMVNFTHQINSQSFISLLKKMPKLLQLGLFNYELKDDLSAFKNTLLCPELLRAELHIRMFPHDDSLARFIIMLPKKLRQLELTIDLPDMKAMNEMTYQEYQRDLVNVRQALEKLIRNHFERLQCFHLYFKPKKNNIVAIQDESLANQSDEEQPEKLELDADTEDSDTIVTRNRFKPNKAAVFESRHVREEIYRINNDNEIIQVIPDDNKLIKEITAEEAGETALLKVNETFENNLNNSMPLIYYVDRFHFLPNKVYRIKSANPNAQLVDNQFGSSLPLKIYHSASTGFFSIEIILPEQKEKVALEINAIFHHPSDEFKLKDFYTNPTHDNRSIAHFKLLPDGQVDLQSLDNHWQSLPENRKLAALTRYFQSFRAGELDATEKKMTGHELQQLLLMKKVGVCRHRTRLFLTIASSTTQQGENLRILGNDSHEWLEFYDKDRWKRIELRGHESNNNVNKKLPFLNIKSVKEEFHYHFESKEAKQEIKPIEEDSFVAKPNVVLDYLDKIVKLPTESPELFFNALLTRLDDARPQALLVTPEHQDRLNLYTHILHYANERQTPRKRQVYFLDDLDEVTKTTLMADQQGNFTIVPGLAHQYLLQQAKKGDILVINFINMKPQHIGYNSVIDSDFRALDGTPIPPGVIVLAITSQECLPGLREDFLSRFPRSEGLIVKLPHWSLAEDKSMSMENVEINLNQRDDWDDLLIGQYKLINGKLMAIQGKLFDVINKPFVLINPPKHCDKFATLIATGQFEFNGRHHSLAAPIKTETRPFKFYIEAILKEPKNNPVHIDWVLNNISFRYIYPTQRYDEIKHVVNEALSIVDQLPNNANILLTSCITEAQWAQLLLCCKEKNKQFYFQKSHEDIEIPDKISQSINVYKPQAEGKQNHSSKPIQFFSCEDVSFALAKLKQSLFDESMTLAVTNHPYSELIERWTITDMKEAADLPSFKLLPGELLNALDTGKTVILHGELSSPFAQLIASLFIPSPYLMFNGKKYGINRGKLIVLGKSLSYLKPDNTIEVDLSDKLELLGSTVKEKKSLFENFETDIDHFQFSDEPDYEALKTLWKSYQINNKAALLAYRYLTTHNSNIEAPILSQQERLNLLCHTLEHFKSVFLMGPSGTGKSSTVLNELIPCLESHQYKVNMLVGLKHLAEWAQSPLPHEMRILFIDEANLTQGLSQLVGVYDEEQPHILLHGQRIKLTLQHKIIFAGNSIGYEGRETHPVFTYSQPIFFRESTYDEIFTKQLVPILNIATENQPELNRVHTIFKLAYENVCFSQNNKDKLITTRNLEMMAMLFVVNYNYEKSKSRYLLEPMLNLNSSSMDTGSDEKWVETAANKAASEVTKDLLPLDGDENESISLLLKEKLKNQHFILTPAHARTMVCLEQMLEVRDFVIQHPQFNKAGTRGLLLEGPSGIGKSAAAVKFLLTQGFSQVDPLADEKENSQQKKFCILTPTHPEKMLAVLNKAFHHGWIVIMDEINSLPLEEYLNAFMSGVDLQGKRAAIPGFNVIGTMNPGDFPGRQPLSPAFINRFRQVQLNDYKKTELIEILNFKYPTLCQNQLTGLAELYLKSKLGNDIPFTLRDIFRIADHELKNALESKAANSECKMEVSAPCIEMPPPYQSRKHPRDGNGTGEKDQPSKRMKVAGNGAALFTPEFVLNPPLSESNQAVAMQLGNSK
jgi:hypothetical protein